MAKKGGKTRVIGLVILGFLFLGLVGLGTRNFGGSVHSVATVGSEEIETSDYARALQQELQSLAKQTGRNFTLAEAEAFGLDRAVLARLIGEAALDAETARLGLSVGDAEVRDQVTKIPAFQGVDGKFDRAAYTAILKREGLSVSDFENKVREETARNLLRGAVVGATTTPQTYVDRLYLWSRETRDITWALLGADDLKEPLPEPSEEDLKAYYDAHEKDFTLSETKVITYDLLTPEMMIDTIKPDEAALKDLYQQRIDEYVQPERRLVERLVFPTEDAAKAAKARLDAGETSFEDLVAERNLTLDDIDLGEVSEKDLGDAGAGVFALTEPGIAGPLPSSLGPALFRVNAILAATETPFEDVKDELAADYAADRARRAIADRQASLDDLLAGGATLEEIADETEMQLGHIDWRQDITDGVAAHQEFRDAALAANPGDFPTLISLEEGGLLALRVDEVRPAQLQPIADVRPEVIAGWEKAETEKRLETQAHEAAQAIEGGAEIAGLGLQLRSERGLARNAFLEDAPAGFVEGVFQMAPGDVRVFKADGGAALVRLDAVNPPDPDTDEAKQLKATFAGQTEQDIAQDAMQMFTGRVQAGTSVSINQQAINAVKSQFP